MTDAVLLRSFFLLSCFIGTLQFRLHVDHLGFRAHEPAALHDNTVSTPSWCLICSLNSASLAAKFQTVPHPAFCASTRLCERGIFHVRFNATQGTHFLCVVRVTKSQLLNVFTTISTVSRFKHFPTPPEFACSFLSASTLRRDKRVVFSSFLLRPLCSVNPLDCSQSRIILTLALASAFTTPAAIPIACKIQTDGLCLQVSTVASTLGNGLRKTALCRLRISGRRSFFCNGNSLSFTTLSSVHRVKTCLCNL